MSEEQGEERKVLQLCPMGKGRVCLDVVDKRPRNLCAWWIPGAKCCAIVQIARKLNDLGALKYGKEWSRG